MKIGNTPITSVLNKSIVLAGIVSAVLLPAGGAQAQSLFHLLNDVSETENIGIIENGGAAQSVSTGRYHVTLGTGPVINAWCTDESHNINFDGSYQADITHHVSDASGALSGPSSGQYYQGGLSSALNAGDYVSPAPTSAQATARADEVAFLIDAFTNSTAVTFSNSSIDTNLKDNLAAIQLSIWDIVQDGGDGLASGTFQSNLSKGDKRNLLVGYYESIASQNSSYTSDTSTWIQAPVTSGKHLQDFATSSTPGQIRVADVPEPGSFAMIAGLCVSGTGLAFRRRTRARKA